jgi:hypothetical protein
MVLLEIHAESIAGVELESNAPRPIDMDRVPRWNETFERVKIKPGKIHLLRRGSGIQPIKTDQDTPVQFGIDLPGATLRPQLRQRLAPKRPDHGIM